MRDLYGVPNSEPSSVDRFGSSKVGKNLGEFEPGASAFTQQEAAVFSYVLSGAVQELYEPEDKIGEGTSAQDAQEILDHQQGKLDKNFRKVASNGPEYFLRIRKQAVDKIKKVQEDGGRIEAVVGQDFDDLGLALSSFNLQELQAVTSLISERTAEEIIGGEFPRGVLEEKLVEKEESESGFKPERTLKDEIGDVVSLFDSLRIFDVAGGTSMAIPFRVFPSSFDAKVIAKARELGIINPVGRTKSHPMDKFSREDFIKLYWATNHYDLTRQRLTPSQFTEIDEVGSAYRDIMAERAKASVVSGK